MCGRSLQVLSLALSVCLLFSFPVVAEKMYQISETELTQLETNNAELEKELKNQEELTIKLQAELSEVKSWLAKSETARLEAESSLTKISLSFDEYEKEVQRTIRGNQIAEILEKVAIGVVFFGAGYLAKTL
jgi:septal ring factor EnvC (AmiA/AmiB activator)